MSVIYIYILVIICSAVGTLGALGLSVSEDEVKKALSRLDKELDSREAYLQQRWERIDSIRGLMLAEGDDERRLVLTMALADEFSSYRNDSALYYYNGGREEAHRLGLIEHERAFALKQATYMPLAAYIAEAVDMYMSVDTTAMAPETLELYYDSGRQMYSYIASFYPKQSDAYERWHNKSMESQRLLLEVLQPSDSHYKLNKGEYDFAMGELPQAKASLLDLVARLPETDNLYARATHLLAEIARANGDKVEEVYYLTLSAIGDTKSATREVTSLQELGVMLFDADNSDVTRAYNYLSTALANAVECKATMRMIQSSAALPIIEQAHKAEIDKWRTRIYFIIGVMAVLLVVLAVVLMVLRRDIRRMRLLQASLENANQVKEVYISQFLNLCSIYMDKLNQLCKTVNRKISTNKVDDLYKITKTGKFVEEESKEFYEVFDDAFLHIYPTFVASVNALMRPDEQIVLRDDERLNTDLRILAFMRLGIEDSTRIAHILNYSVYTIYTYRNRLKNRAIDRANFEADIMKISSIS
ncbi:MAG: hypothetical protein K2L93_01580 [Muribaculaceae bacterium]|nr:hypothetical protein [Muribaculaceae bacterium]